MAEEAVTETEVVEPVVVEPVVAAWTDGMSDELKGYVETKGFKDPVSVADAYRNFEKLMGAPKDKLLRLPDQADAEGAMDPIYDRLGRPETPEGYTNALGDGFNDDVFKAAAATAHKLGLNDAQFKGLQGVMQEQALAIDAARDTEAAAAFDTWKAKNSDGFTNAARLMAGVGMNEEALAGLLSGDKVQMYDFLAKVAARSSEGQVIHGEQPTLDGFGMSPLAAKTKISELFQDDAFMKQYTNSNQALRQPAIDRMTRLQEAAAKGTT